MGLGSIVSLAAATFGAAVGAFEGVVHLGGEVRKLSSRELLYGKQPDSVASEADKATPGTNEAPAAEQGHVTTAADEASAPTAHRSAPGTRSPPEVAELPLPPSSPVRAATVKINARAKENNRHSSQDYNISRGYRLPVKPTEFAAKPASRMQHCKSLHDRNSGSQGGGTILT